MLQTVNNTLRMIFCFIDGNKTNRALIIWTVMEIIDMKKRKRKITVFWMLFECQFFVCVLGESFFMTTMIYLYCYLIYQRFTRVPWSGPRFSNRSSRGHVSITALPRSSVREQMTEYSSSLSICDLSLRTDLNLCTPWLHFWTVPLPRPSSRLLTCLSWIYFLVSST